MKRLRGYKNLSAEESIPWTLKKPAECLNGFIQYFGMLGRLLSIGTKFIQG